MKFSRVDHGSRTDHALRDVRFEKNARLATPVLKINQRRRRAGKLEHADIAPALITSRGTLFRDAS